MLVVGTPDRQALTVKLVESLALHGLPDAQVTVERVASIERHEATGKLKRFVALAP